MSSKASREMCEMIPFSPMLDGGTHLAILPAPNHAH